MRGRAIKVDGEVREASLRGWKEKNEYGWHLPKHLPYLVVCFTAFIYMSGRVCFREYHY